MTQNIAGRWQSQSHSHTDTRFPPPNMPSISFLTFSQTRAFPPAQSPNPSSLFDTSTHGKPVSCLRTANPRFGRAAPHPYKRSTLNSRFSSRRVVTCTNFKSLMEAAGWSLPRDIVDYTQRTLSCGWAPRTIANHAGAVRRYERFCSHINVPAHLIWPAHEPILCAFAADHAGRVSKSTAQNELAGIKAHHTSLNLPWPDSPRIRMILEGVERSRPSHSLLPSRPPVTLDMIRQLVSDLSLRPSSLDSAVQACATVAFWGQFRLGEILPTSQAAFSSSFHPASESWHDGQSPSIVLPWTKTTRTRGAVVTMFKQSSRTCPIANMKRYIARTALVPGSALFAYQRPDGRRVTLTKRVFLERVNTIWASHGIKRITGHSFRIGGTTELLRRGVPPEVVKMAGRWSSDSFLRYWRKPEDILPQHIQDVITSAAC
jgi:hypothetical protein